MSQLQHKSEYLVRVCAVRQCSGGSADLTGAYSPGVAFRTLEPKPLVTASATPAAGVVGRSAASEHRLTDQHWAIIILSGFAIFAVIVAFTAQQIITYTNSGSSSSNADGNNGSSAT